MRHSREHGSAAPGASNPEATEAAEAARGRLIAGRRGVRRPDCFSDPVGAKLQFLREAVAANHRVTLCYVGLASAQLSEARVAQRVRAGGHDVPPERWERRFRNAGNLARALKFATEVHVFDHRSSDAPDRLVLSRRDGETEFTAAPPQAWLAAVAPKWKVSGRRSGAFPAARAPTGAPYRWPSYLNPGADKPRPMHNSPPS